MVELCWVYDAIKVIDNQEKSFNVKSVNVCEVAKTLENFKKNINYEKNEFNQNLKDVYNYFKKYKMKIMVLGHTGMLGHTVHEYFKRNNFDVITTNFRFPKKEFKDDILKFDGDFIINCIGSIPQKTSDFKVNSDLPIWLSNNSETKIIHAGTDCEIDNDDYGISKKIASEYISLFSDNTKILKTSIIGLENGTKYGLLEWFLSQEKQVFGYTGAIWNGNTTLEWVKQAYTLMVNWYNYEKITVIEGCEINKYNMLKLFNKVFEKNIKITPKNLGIDKTLKGKIKTQNLEVQLIELKKFWGL
jgi:dTDP-4-dehydrorhamnose reductase